MKSFLYSRLDFKSSAILKFFRIPIFVASLMLISVSVWLTISFSSIPVIIMSTLLILISALISWISYISNEIFVQKNAEFIASHMTSGGGLFSSKDKSISEAILKEFGVSHEKSNDPELNNLSKQLDREEIETKNSIDEAANVFNGQGTGKSS